MYFFQESLGPVVLTMVIDHVLTWSHWFSPVDLTGPHAGISFGQ